MSRRTLWYAWLAILAATGANSAEFHFDARVDVVPALTILVGEFPQIQSEETTLQIFGSQDQCLQWSWSDVELGYVAGSETTVILAADGSSEQNLPTRSISHPVLHLDLN